MNKGRLEAFSDGVIAILITIMVLERHKLQTRNGIGQGREGQVLTTAVHRGNPFSLCQSVGLRRALCVRGADVAGSGPADRVEAE